MPLLCSALYAWSAVHAIAALMTAFLHARQRRPEHLAFSIAAALLALYCVFAAQVASAPTEAEAAGVLSWQYATGAAYFVVMVVLAHFLTDAPGARLVRFLIGAGSVSAALPLTGLFVDPAQPMLDAEVLPWGHAYHDPAVLPAMAGFTAFGVLLGGYTVVQLRTPARRGAEGRLMMAALGFTVLGWMLDVGMRIAEIRGLYMTEHLASIGALGVSYLLMQRFVRTANELSSRTVELRHSYHELRHVQGELVRKEQLAAVGELSAVIAHEVRNPLAVLRNATAGLRRDTLEAEDRHVLLAVLDEESDRLNRLVRDLLTYARPVEPQSIRFDLAEVVREALGKAHAGRETPIDTDVTLGKHIEGFEGDRDLLRRAFTNIAENAMQAMPEGGRLSVSAARVELDDEGSHGVAIRFEDTGEGMDTLVRSRARDPFFTTRPSGTGLGLAIVERVVGAHGGHIELQSGSDGTTVTVILPMRPRPRTPPPPSTPS